MKSIKERFTRAALPALVVGSFLTTGVFTYKALQEQHAINIKTMQFNNLHHGRSEIELLKERTLNPTKSITIEDREILSEGNQLRTAWVHEKKMHGLAILSYLVLMTTGTALLWRDFKNQLVLGTEKKASLSIPLKHTKNNGPS